MMYISATSSRKCRMVLDNYAKNRNFKIKECMDLIDEFVEEDRTNGLFYVEINEIHVECLNGKEYTIRRKTRMQYEMDGKTYMSEHIDQILRENGGVKKVVPAREVKR